MSLGVLGALAGEVGVEYSRADGTAAGRRAAALRRRWADILNERLSWSEAKG